MIFDFFKTQLKQHRKTRLNQNINHEPAGMIHLGSSDDNFENHTLINRLGHKLEHERIKKAQNEYVQNKLKSLFVTTYTPKNYDNVQVLFNWYQQYPNILKMMEYMDGNDDIQKILKQAIILKDEVSKGKINVDIESQYLMFIDNVFEKLSNYGHYLNFPMGPIPKRITILDIIEAYQKLEHINQALAQVALANILQWLFYYQQNNGQAIHQGAHNNDFCDNLLDDLDLKAILQTYNKDLATINQYLCNYGFDLWRIKDDAEMRDLMVNTNNSGQIRDGIFIQQNNAAYDNWLNQLSILSMSVVLEKPLIPKMVPNIKSFSDYVQELKLNDEYQNCTKRRLI